MTTKTTLAAEYCVRVDNECEKWRKEVTGRTAALASRLPYFHYSMTQMEYYLPPNFPPFTSTAVVSPHEHLLTLYSSHAFSSPLDHPHKTLHICLLQVPAANTCLCLSIGDFLTAPLMSTKLDIQASLSPGLDLNDRFLRKLR